MYPWQNNTVSTLSARPSIASWCVLANRPDCLIIDETNTFIYASTDNGFIEQINISDGTDNNSEIYSNGTGTELLQMDIAGTYLYVADSINNVVSQIDLSYNPNVNTSWCSVNSPFGLVINGDFLYCTNVDSGNTIISQINLSDGSFANQYWCGGLGSDESLYSLAIYGNYMYVGTNNGVAQISMTDGVITNQSWCTTYAVAPFISIYNNIMYATTFGQGGCSVVEIDMANGSILRSNINNGLVVQGTAVLGNQIYIADYQDHSIIKLSLLTSSICFHEDTKILTDKGYVVIRDLRKGDLVKTALHGFIPIESIGHSNIYNPSNLLRSKNRLYRCTKDNYPDLNEDLIVTGCHSILVDDLTDEQKEDTIDMLGRIMITDKKYRLMACLDKRSEPYEMEGLHTIWHFALEHTDRRMNYGVYANGLLVETTSIRMMHELSGMELVE